jgi:hypothetical protein
MAKRRTKPLVFQFENDEVTFDMIKVDRSKLYGFKELEVTDDDGNGCELATLAEDGRTIIGKGGTGIGYLAADGCWAAKSNLKPVDIEGEEITPVKSSFGAPIPLTEKVDVTEFLNHNIRLSYLMQPEALHENLMKSLTDGAIYRFPYSYRGGLEADAGFLLMNAEQQVFFLVGDPTVIEFVGLQQAASVAPDAEAAEAESEGGGLMDFGMI